MHQSGRTVSDLMISSMFGAIYTPFLDNVVDPKKNPDVPLGCSS